MDIARFHFAVHSIVRDFRITNANDQLSSLISALSNVCNQPGQPQFIEQYKNQLEVVRQALENSSLNDPKMELAEFIEQFHLQSFIGNGLFRSIVREISENQIAPQAALQALDLLQRKLAKKISELAAVDDAFTQLEVPYEDEDDNDTEIEIRIPVDRETKTLNDLSVEAKEWHREISTISEIFDAERPESTVRTIATGSWQFYLASTPLVLFGIAKCLRGINEILRELVKSKDLLKKLIETKAPKKVIEEYEQHLESSASKNLSLLASNLVDTYYKGADDGRKAELKVALTQSLKRLSKKISEGAKVSLRITRPVPPKIVDPEKPTIEELAAIESSKNVEEIRALTLDELSKVEQLEHDPEIVKCLQAPDSTHV